MLYKLLHFFHTEISALNVFRYITFRTILSTLTAMVICILLGKWTIAKLKELQIGQHIRKYVPKSHIPKAGTPTMGGILILTSVIATCLAWGDIQNIYVWITIFVAVSFVVFQQLDTLCCC
jgi:phospho-N-acetylmuramoyl-pentapeptide-transferase